MERLMQKLHSDWATEARFTQRRLSRFVRFEFLHDFHWCETHSASENKSHKECREIFKSKNKIQLNHRKGLLKSSNHLSHILEWDPALIKSFTAATINFPRKTRAKIYSLFNLRELPRIFEAFKASVLSDSLNLRVRSLLVEWGPLTVFPASLCRAGALTAIFSHLKISKFALEIEKNVSGSEISRNAFVAKDFSNQKQNSVWNLIIEQQIMSLEK
jgi:hypothetical protein